MATEESKTPNFDSYQLQPKAPKIVFLIVFGLILLSVPVIAYGVFTDFTWRIGNQEVAEEGPPPTEDEMVAEVVESPSPLPDNLIVTNTVATDSASSMSGQESTQSGQPQATQSGSIGGNNGASATPSASVSSTPTPSPSATSKPSYTPTPTPRPTATPKPASSSAVQELPKAGGPPIAPIFLTAAVMLTVIGALVLVIL